jgi:hypothetical protein
MGRRQDLYDPRLHKAKIKSGFKLEVNADTAATGSSIATSRAITPGITRVTASNGTRGVVLTEPVANGDGDAYLVKNTVTTTGGTLKIYPPSASHSIDGATAGGALTVGLGVAVLLVNTGKNQWTSVTF